MNIKDLIVKTGLKQIDFARRYRIKYSYINDVIRGGYTARFIKDYIELKTKKGKIIKLFTYKNPEKILFSGGKQKTKGLNYRAKKPKVKQSLYKLKSFKPVTDISNDWINER